MIIIREFERRSTSKPRQALLEYSKETAIYFESDPNKYWYEVVSGIVRTCRFHPDGRRQLTGFHYAGDVFGVEDGECHGEAAEAVTDVLVRQHDWPADVDAPGTVTSQRMAVWQRALASARRSIFLFGHKSASARVAAFLLAIDERRPAEDVEVAMSRTDIADYLGLTIHTVSRTISDLARQDLIELDGPKTMRIANRAALRIVAGLDPEICERVAAPCSPWAVK